MVNKKTSAILKEYDQKVSLYADFSEKTYKLVLELLKYNNIAVHSITNRVKTKRELSIKIRTIGV